MNLKASEFWKLAKEYDKSTRQYVNPKHHRAAMGLEEHPAYGPGSNGGGRICICENCGIAEWTHSSTRNFCSPSCKNEFYSANRTPSGSTIIRKRGNVSKKCSFCGKDFTISMHRLRKGHGVYCSTKCANHARGFTPLWYICNTCNSEFRSVTSMGSRYCCTQCAERKPLVDEEGVYCETVPHLVNPEDKFEHMINLILEKHLRKAQKKAFDIYAITISPSLRMKVITGSMKNKIVDYYLNKKERETLKLMDMLVSEAKESYVSPIDTLEDQPENI